MKKNCNVTTLPSNKTKDKKSVVGLKYGKKCHLKNMKVTNLVYALVKFKYLTSEDPEEKIYFFLWV